MLTQKRVIIGELFEAPMPWSEVCCHKRVAGKVMGVKMLSDRAAQLFTIEDTVGTPNYHEFSFPILLGEAGIFTDTEGYYVYQEAPKRAELVQ